MKQLERFGGVAVLSIALLFILGSGLPASADCGRCGGGSAGEAADEGCPGRGGEGGCCGMGRQQGRGAGKGRGAGRGAGMGQGQGSDHDMIHSLLDHHEAIQRQVEEIEGGVETTTTSKDPEVTALIREHVRSMKQRVEAGHGMRWWDPTFAEIFKHHEKIEMEIEDIEGGVRVREFSSDPDVALLIRQHAVRGVSEFVAAGHARARKETPLPEGYGR